MIWLRKLVKILPKLLYNGLMSNKFAKGSLISSLVCLLFYMVAYFLTVILVSYNTVNNIDPGEGIFWTMHLIISVGGVIGVVSSMVTAIVLAIMGLKKSKQLNGRGKTMSIVALSLISIPMFLLFYSLINANY
ncbi:MAG: hypothetical protein OXF49_02825 [Candidatus Saccharibacteria bacterium]|nr:hypothetical protein [Candidatus Saccharibacteria bacterium]